MSADPIGRVEMRLDMDLDVSSRREIVQRAEDALAMPGITELVVNLAGAEFVDSSGIGAMVTVLIKARDLAVPMRMINASHGTYAILERVGLIGIFRVEAQAQPRSAARAVPPSELP